MSIDLRKRAEESLIDLSKKATISLTKKGLNGVRARVALALDISGSMSDLFRKGVVQRTCERTLGLAMNFDDNQAADVFLFGVRDHAAGEIAKSNFYEFVDREIIRKYPLEPGTNYAGVIRRIIDFYFPKALRKSGKTGSFFGLGGKQNYTIDASAYRNQVPVYVIFVTDGNCFDDADTEEMIRLASELGLFFQFVGVGNERFAFLDKLDNLPGRFIDNANFFSVRSLDRMNDDELYDKLLGEFPSWINEARSKQLIQ
jgi:hypothetical protein